VNLKDRSCTCGNFYKYHGPCTYAITACKHAIEDPYKHFNNAYTIRHFRRFYQVVIPLITIENLSSDPDLHPPRLVKKQGRPKTTRIRKGAWNRKQRKCGNCLQLGHNRRRCTNQPSSKNGRRERARN
jgi:hypothetical protein